MKRSKILLCLAAFNSFSVWATDLVFVARVFVDVPGREEQLLTIREVSRMTLQNALYDYSQTIRNQVAEGRGGKIKTQKGTEEISLAHKTVSPSDVEKVLVYIKKIPGIYQETTETAVRPTIDQIREEEKAIGEKLAPLIIKDGLNKEEILKLLTVANYLDIPGLIEGSCYALAEKLTTKDNVVLFTKESLQKADAELLEKGILGFIRSIPIELQILIAEKIMQPYEKEKPQKFANVRWFEWSPDGTMIAVTLATDDRVEIVRVNDGEVLKSFDDVARFDWSPDGAMMAVMYTDHREEIVRVSDWQVLKVLENVFFLHWSPDSSKVLVDLTDDRGEQLVSVHTWRELKKFDGQVLVDFSWSPDYKKVAFWDKYTGAHGQLMDAGDSRVLKTFRNEKISFLSWSPDSTMALVAFKDGHGQIVSTRDGQEIKALDNARSVSWSPGSTMVLVTFKDGHGQIVSARDGKVFKSFETLDRQLSFSDFNSEWSPDSMMVAVSLPDDSGQIVRISDGKVLKSFEKLDHRSFGKFKWSPDSTMVAVGFSNSRGEIVSVSDWQNPQLFNDVGRFEWSPDSKKVTVISQDNRVQIVSARYGKELKTFNNVPWNGFHFHWSPDSTMVAVPFRNGRGEIFEFKPPHLTFKKVTFPPIYQALGIVALSHNQNLQLPIGSFFEEIWNSFNEDGNDKDKVQIILKDFYGIRASEKESPQRKP